MITSAKCYFDSSKPSTTTTFLPPMSRSQRLIISPKTWFTQITYRISNYELLDTSLENQR